MPGIHEDDATYTVACQDEDDSGETKGFSRTSDHMFSTVCIYDHGKERGVFLQKTHHYPAKGRCEGTTQASPGLTLKNISRDPKVDETSKKESRGLNRPWSVALRMLRTYRNGPFPLHLIYIKSMLFIASP